MNNKFRLDKNAQPEKYEIFIEPDLENEKFTGNESIHLSINKPTKQIKLNSIGLKINNVKLIDSNKEEVYPDIKFDDEHEMVEFNFNQEINSGNYSLFL